MHYAITMNDGSLRIMQTVGAAKPADCIAKWTDSDQVATVTEIDPATLPADRSFRNAWKHDGVRFDYDMERARDILRARLRAERTPLLAQLDVDYQRADEAKDETEKARVAAKKKALRDVPAHPLIEKAGTVDDLNALTFDILTK